MQTIRVLLEKENVHITLHRAGTYQIGCVSGIVHIADLMDAMPLALSPQ